MSAHETHSRPQSRQSADASHRQTPLSSPVFASSMASSMASSVTSPTNHFYQFGQTVPQPWPQTMADAGQMGYGAWPPVNSDYYRQYVDQYYREYYRQYLHQQRATHLRPHASSHTTPVSSLQRQPLKYGSRGSHARALFSWHNNHVLLLDNNSAQKSIRIYSLTDLFVDYLFPNQMFHLLLRATETRLPFASRDLCLQWIRGKQQATTALTTVTSPTTSLTSPTTADANFELKLILKVIQMLLKQNGVVSGLDLSELLFDLIDFQNLNKTFIYSENEFQNSSLNNYRALLIRGQRSVALNHALSTGLFAHALTLSYLGDALDDARRHRRHSTTDETTLKTVRKFCDTLSADDPISVFYNSVLNEICGKRSVIFSLSFESFLILLSNERDLKSIEIQNSENTQSFRHLLDLIKSLMNAKTTSGTTPLTTPSTTPDDDFVLSDDLFDSDFDSVLVNECLEFARFNGKRFNSRLLERKVKFVSILFDFGFVSNALEYCKQIRSFCDLRSNPSARTLISQLESRFCSDFAPEFTNETTPTTPTTPEVTTHSDVYHNDDSATSVESSPERALPEEPPSEPKFDFYQQIVTQNPNPSEAPPELVPPEAPLPAVIGAPMASLGASEPFSFVSQPYSAPKMDFIPQNKDFFAENGIPNHLDDAPNEKTTRDDRGVVGTTPETTPRDDQKAKDASQGILSKLTSVFKPRNQVHLPDDSKMTLIYDKNTNQWVDTSEANGSAGGAPPGLRPPPVGPPAVAPQGLRFDRSRRPRYVDITRK